MTIGARTLDDIEGSEEKFATFIIEYCEQVYARAGLSPRFSLQRLAEAHGAWKHDLSRVGTHEPKIEDGLDHFKRSGHLSFWLRRFAPIVEAHCTLDSREPTVGESQWRELLFSYANEYVAFMIGFNISLFYERYRSDLFDNPRAARVRLTNDYVETICHFLKYKSVSPHALTSIYKSLFVGD
jgi:hypothetical protein